MSAHWIRRRLLGAALALALSPLLAVFLALTSAQASNQPIPVDSFGSVSAPLIGQNVTFDVDFVNTSPSATGYGPYVDLRFPLGADGNDGLTFTSATYLGAAVTSVQLTADAGGCITHPYAVQVSGAPVQVCGLPVGQSYVVLRLPFGSFTPGQPAATVHVTAALSNLADAGTPLTIGAQGGFQFGADALNDPATDPSTLGGLVTTNVTPTVMRVTKIYNGPENETATGPNFPRTYTINVSIAPGQTVKSLIVSDTLPGTLQYVSTSTPTSPASSEVAAPDPSIPGGTVSRNFGDVTGTGGTDATMTFTFYVPRLDAGASPVLDPSTGAFNTSTDSASASGTWPPLDVRDATGPVSAGPATHTLTDKSIAVQKTVSIADDTGPAGVSPGDTLKWTISVQVSDYFALSNMVVDDLLGDGTRVDGSAPTLAVSGNGYTSAAAPMSGANYDYSAVNGLGKTPISFRVSDELVTRVSDGRMVGGCINPNTGTTAPDCSFNDGPTTATITFKSVVQRTYVNGTTEVVEGDTLVNQAAATATVLNTKTFASTGNTIGDGSAGVATAGTSASVSIDRGSLTKSIYAINGNTSFSTPVHVSPGDLVTYRLQQVFPTSRTDGFRMLDYLPLPVFYASGLTVFDQVASSVAPLGGHAQWGPADTFHAEPGAPVPTVNTDITANSIEFDYGDYALYPPASSTADILFTVTVSTDPFADGLLLTNQARSETSNSVGTIQTADAIIQLTLDQPVLAVTKGVVGADNPAAVFSPTTVGPVTFATPAAPPSVGCPGWSGGSITSSALATGPIDSNVSGLDAGDYVRFAITVENTGHADAYQVQVKDTVPAGFQIPGGGTDMCIVRGDKTVVAATNIGGGSGLFDQGIQLSDTGGPLAAGTSGGAANSSGTNITVISYTLRVATSVTPNQTIANTASLLDFVNAPGSGGHLSSPLTDDATVTMTEPSAAKLMTATSLTNTSGTAVAIGETVTYQLTVTVPEGSLPGAMVVDTLPAGLAFKDCNPISDCLSIAASPGLSTSLPGGFTDVLNPGVDPTVGAGGQLVTFSLGDVTNADVDNATPETIRITYDAVVLNVVGNTRGQPLQNSAVVSWTGGSLASVAAPAVHVVEPGFTVAKSAAPNTGDAGDHITYTITVTNVSNANGEDAFDVSLSDVVPTGMSYDALSLVQNSGPAVTLDASGAPTLTATWDEFPQGAVAVLQFSAKIGDMVTPATVFTNTANVAFTSLPGDVTATQSTFSTVATERTGKTADPGGALNNYRASGSANVTVPKASVAKTMTGGNIADTVDPAVAVGEVVGYQLVLTIPEGSEPAAKLTDTLPAGLAFKDCVSVAGSNDADLTTTLAGGFGDACSPALAPAGNPTVSAGGQVVTFDLGSITNANRDNGTAETITIKYEAVVLNVASNSRGTSLTNSAVISWTGGSSVVGSAPAIHVVEPAMTIGKTRNPTTGDAGDTITYTITLANPVNANGAKAYDVVWSDTIPGGMTYVGGSLQTTAGTAPDSTSAVGQNLSATWSATSYPQGATTTLTYQVTLDSTVQPGQTLTNAAQVTWTGLPGAVGNQAAPFSAVAAERTGSASDPGGAANNYKQTSAVGVTITQPAPTKTIYLSSEAGTSNQYMAIGEIVRFRIMVQIPEGTFPNAAILDNLPNGLRYLNDGTTDVAFVTNGGGAGISSDAFGPDPSLSVSGNMTWAGHPTFVLPGGQVAGSPFNDGSDPTFNLGTLTNADRDADGEAVVIEFNALVDNVAGNTRGVNLQNTATIKKGVSNLATSGNCTVTIAEPNITFAKTITTTPTDAGDTIVYRITLSNASGATISPAYDLAVTDSIDSHINVSSIVVAGPGTWHDTSNTGTGTVDVVFDAVAPGAAANTITITGTMSGTVPNGQQINNTANATWTSLPGANGTTSNGTGSANTGTAGTATGERTGSGIAPNNYKTSSTPSAVTMAEPSISKLGPTPASATIGGSTTFDLVVTVPEGTATGLTVVDHLPAGLIASGYNVVTSAASSGGRLTEDYPGAISVSTSTPPVGSGGGDWTLTFGNPVDPPDAGAPDTTNNSFLLQLTVKVANVVGNQSGGTLSNTASLGYTNPQTGSKTFNAPTARTVGILEPVLQAVKTVDNPSPHFGDTIKYTLTLSDTVGSNADAFDVTLGDTLPAGLAYVGSSLTNTAGLTPSSASVAGNTVSITFGSFPLGSSSTFTYQATVGNAGQVSLAQAIANSVQTKWTSIAGADANERTGADGVGGLNDYVATASAGITVSGADLDVSKTDGQATATAGAVRTYTLTYHNTGNQAASGVVITETIPIGATYTGSGWVCPSGTTGGHTCTKNVGAVAAGENGSATFQITVVDPIPSGLTSIVNNATIADDGTHGAEPTPGDNSTSDTDTIAVADLSLTKTVDDGTPDANQVVVFTLTLHNAGPSQATNVRVTDYLPAQLNYVGSSPSQGSYTAGTGVWDIGAVANGASPTLTVSARVVSPTPVTNTAQVTHSDQDDPDSTPANGVVSEDDYASAPITPNIADLSITKVVDNDHPNVGDDVTFTIVATNGGPADATGVSVTDILPASLTYKSSSASQGSYVSGTHIWSVGSLANGASATLHLTATVGQAGTISNSASVTGNQYDPDNSNNSASTSVDQLVDLSVAKSVDDPATNVGQVATFTVTVTNAGPSGASGVVIHDALPAGLDYASATASAGSYDDTTGDWTVGAVPASGSATLSLKATVSGTSAMINTATVTAVNEPQVTTDNDSASATVTPPHADLAVSKAVDVARPDPGDADVFTVTVTNNGPDQATNVALSDVLPAGLTYVNSHGSQGTYDPDTHIWTVGTLAADGVATLRIDVTVDSAGDYTNTASVSHSDQYDPDPDNNTDSTQVHTRVSDIAIAKTVDKPAPPVGSIVKFTITATNDGPDPASQIVVADTLPADFVFVSATPSQGSYSDTTGLWSVGSLAVNASATLEIDARVVNSGHLSNTASLSSLLERDTNSSNDSATATLDAPDAADLSLTKSVDNLTPNLHDNVTYTVTVSNHGPNDATGVAVSDPLPAGVDYVSSSASAGTYDPGTGIWTVGPVSNGGSQTLTLVAKVNTVSTATNTAEVSASDLPDPDSTPANGAKGEDDIDSATIHPTRADLAIAKSVDDPTPDVGADVTFTLTASNLGPSDATGVAVTDHLPAGLTYKSSAASAGGYDGSTGVWTIGNLGNGSTATLSIVATVSVAGTITNTATITGDQYDPVPANNTATTGTDQLVDLVVTKTVADASINTGSNAVFTVTVANSGPGTAHHVVIADKLPAGLTYVSDSPSQGSYDSVTGDWTVGTIARSGSAALTLTAAVATGAPATNTAVVKSLDEPQSSTANDSASATVTPPTADLRVHKTVADAAPETGAADAFTVTVTNAGPDPATGVTLFDRLPAGLTYVSNSASQGTYDVSTGLWQIGSLSNGASVTWTVHVLVASGGDYTNTAAITLHDQFDPDTTNNSASASLSTRSADVAVAKVASKADPGVGTDVTFTVTATNKGPDTATQLVIHDPLPAGLTLVTATPSVGKYAADTGLWSIGTLADGASGTLTIKAHVVGSGSIANTAAVSHLLQRDPDPSNDSATTTIKVPKAADLSLTKTVNLSKPNLNDSVTFTIRVTNHGPNDTTGVHVSDPLPAGLTYVSSTPSVGTYDSSSGDWAVGNLANGATVTLTIKVKVSAEGPVTNTAEVKSSGLPDPDSTPGNGKVGEDDQASVGLNTKGLADLSLVKKVVSSGGRVGTQVVYSLTVHNAGPDPATGVIVRDQLPKGLTYVSSDGGTYDSRTGAWNVGRLAVGASAVLKVTAQIDSAGTITNVAEVVASDQRDPNSTPDNGNPKENDESSAGVTTGLATPPPTATNPPETPLSGGLPLWLLGMAAAALLLTTSVLWRIRIRKWL